MKEKANNTRLKKTKDSSFSASDKEDEILLLHQLSKDDQTAFNHLFETYYQDLLFFAGNFIPSRNICEDIVQSIFAKLWTERKSLSIEKSIKSYLLKTVRNHCLDYIRHLNIKQEYENYMTENHGALESYNTENYLLYSDLHQHLQAALAKLPPEKRDVLILSRLEGIKYKEIAARLKISERTVEVRISDALKELRLLLKDFLVTLIAIFFI